MPFFEQLLASKVIFFAEKGALCSLCMLIVKLYLSKVSCLGDMQATLEFFEIDIRT
jgi:hypothetical protein